MSWTKKIKDSWVYAFLTVAVVAYLVTMWIVGSGMSASRLCQGLTITVHDTAHYKFVTPRELVRELGDLPKIIKTLPLNSINIDSIERMLMEFDKIENVNVNILTDGTVSIDVVPMRPVARIFDSKNDSYYINRSGKRIKATARYYMDVPVVVGNFDARMPATSILPLIDRIEGDSLMKSFVSMIKVDSPTDIILVPSIRGHVINIGDTLNYDDKFRRLHAMYTNVMKVKGWECYDTLTVKWDGQVVASRRDKSLPEADMIVETENKEAVDVSTMMSGPNVAPGQALPNRPVQNDRPIPAQKTVAADRVKPSTDQSDKKEE